MARTEDLEVVGGTTLPRGVGGEDKQGDQKQHPHEGEPWRRRGGKEGDKEERGEGGEGGVGEDVNPVSKASLS